MPWYSAFSTAIDPILLASLARAIEHPATGSRRDQRKPVHEGLCGCGAGARLAKEAPMKRSFSSRLFAWARVSALALPLYCLAVHLQGCAATQEDVGGGSSNVTEHGPYGYGYGGDAYGYGSCEGYGYGDCP
jgi:hypothetical protein